MNATQEATQIDPELSYHESMIQIVGHAVSMFSLFISVSILLFFK